MRKELKEKLRQDPIKWANYQQKRREHKRRQLERIKNDPIRSERYKSKQKKRYEKKRKERLERKSNSPYYQSSVGWERHKYHTFKVLVGQAKSRCKIGKITASDLWSIAKRQRCVCPITGEKLTSQNISLDHIIPISKGGTNNPSNIQLVTRRANTIKNDMNHDELILFCQAVINRLTHIGGGVPAPL